MTASEVTRFNPQYVQIGKREACAILGKPLSTFDRDRKVDPDFPQPISGGTGNQPLRFVLADIYAYSALLIERGRAQGGAA